MLLVDTVLFAKVELFYIFVVDVELLAKEEFVPTVLFVFVVEF